MNTSNYIVMWFVLFYLGMGFLLGMLLSSVLP